VPVHSLQEMVALVKANPGKYLYGSGGSGTSPHLTMEWLKHVAGLNLAHVPYRGGDRLEHHHSTLVSTVRPARVAAVIKLVTDRRSVTPWA
jgi:hypothetical protein